MLVEYHQAYLPAKFVVSIEICVQFNTPHFAEYLDNPPSEQSLFLQENQSKDNKTVHCATTYHDHLFY